VRRVLAVAIVGACLWAQGRALGQDAGLNPAVTQRIEAEFLTLDEKHDLRVYHGVWTEDDLDTPARRAAAALVVGALDHEWLMGEVAPALDRAEAALGRGDLDECLELVGDDDSIRGIRIRAQALADLGRFDEADAALDALVKQMAEEKLDAAGLTEGVRGLRLRTWIRGSVREGGMDYRQILSLLNKARDELDRLAWPVRLAEAELLYSRHNRKEAVAAAQEVLALNPRCAPGMAILGLVAVDGFDFDRANAIADEMDLVAAELGSVNARADVIRVRALLRQREAHEAEEPLERLLGAYPNHRGGLALAAAAKAGAYEDEQVDSMLAFFDELSPGHPLAWYEVARVRSETRQYAQAADAFAEAIKRQPNWPGPHIDLGLMEMQSGRDAQALTALRRAMELDPFNTRAANSLKLMEELASYQRIESEHFVVRYRPGIDEALAREMSPILEKIYDRVTGGDRGGIDFEPIGKTTIELMPNHEWFAVRITGMPSIHTMAASTGPVIAMESPQEGPGFTVGPYDWARVLQHEYTHTVTLARTNNRIPHWMTEASAVYLEDAPRDSDRWKLLAQVDAQDGWFDFEYINIAFIRPEQPTDRSQAYAQGHWMYSYIIERWGGYAPLELMDEAAAGVTEAQAFEKVLGVTREDFLDAFKTQAHERLIEVGLVLDDSVESLETLLEPWTAAWIAGGVEPSLDDRLEALRQLADSHPDHPQVLEALIGAEMEFAGGQVDESMVDLLERYARVCPVDDLPHRLLASRYLSRDDREERRGAIEHLIWLDERQTTSPAYAAELARQFVAAGDMEQAQFYAERASRIAPFDANEREYAARVALAIGDLETAERHIVALTIIEPDRPQHAKRLEAVRKMRDSGAGG
jgi:tetratricopeptide (TPR) repeat protein